MIITGKQVILRETSPDDPLLTGLVEDADYLSSMSEVRLYPPNMPTQITFRVEFQKEVVGEIKLKSIRWFNRKAELSILISPKVQGKGYGRDALRATVRYSFEKMNLHRLEAEVIEYNKTSRLLLEEYGFVQEGRLREAKFSGGKYYDILRYSLLSNEYFQIKNND